MKTLIKVLFLVIILIIIVFGFRFFKQKVNFPASTTFKSVAISIPELVTEKSETEYVTIDMSYPALSDKKYPELSDYVKKSKQDFLNDFGTVSKEDAVIMHLGGDRRYNYTLVTKIATSTKTISFIVEVYTFTGGAHGGTTDTTFTYDSKGKLVTLSDIFNSPYLEKISNFARTYLYDKLSNESRKESIDAGTESKVENYSTWYLTDKNIVFIFGQYSIGPYVIGIQEFPLEKKLIEDIINPDFK